MRLFKIAFLDLKTIQQVRFKIFYEFIKKLNGIGKNLKGYGYKYQRILIKWQGKLKIFIDKYNLDIGFTQFTTFVVT
ncbi:hypothetical protein [Borreliella garinii]|uniref:hypothetical protein n=1 Tax=Borreliella garinii TaxID=29519 RepID=UPI001AEDB016|nr:hypothetical protein [Borreliella garinii]